MSSQTQDLIKNFEKKNQKKKKATRNQQSNPAPQKLLNQNFQKNQSAPQKQNSPPSSQSNQQTEQQHPVNQSFHTMQQDSLSVNPQIQSAQQHTASNQVNQSIPHQNHPFQSNTSSQINYMPNNNDYISKAPINQITNHQSSMNANEMIAQINCQNEQIKNLESNFSYLFSEFIKLQSFVSQVIPNMQQAPYPFSQHPQFAPQSFNQMQQQFQMQPPQTFMQQQFAAQSDHFQYPNDMDEEEEDIDENDQMDQFVFGMPYQKQ